MSPSEVRPEFTWLYGPGPHIRRCPRCSYPATELTRFNHLNEEVCYTCSFQIDYDEYT